jgi:hypothetical protein
MDITLNPDKRTLASSGRAFFLVILLVILLGNTFGLKVRHDPGMKHRVVLRSGESIDDAATVMLLSHHTVLLSKGKLFIVPSVDITGMVGTLAP